MARLATALVAAEVTRSHAPIAALSGHLDELVSQLIVMDPDAYIARPASVTGSIGEHVRHVLDHVAALVAADPSATLSYDHRERGTAIETDVSAALRQVLRLKAALERWASRSLDEPVFIEAIVSSSGDAVAGWSTLSRELAFVVSHTIHHLASIALLLYMQGLVVPERFGYAPTTPTPGSSGPEGV